MRSDGSFANNNFTVLRLALALLVVLGHFKAFAGVFSPPWPFSYAAMAVESFFVISGYLVTDSFDRDPNIKRFLIKRFCRIYPLYLTVVVAQTILLSHLAPPGSSVDPGAMARYLLANALFANFLQHDLGQGVLQGLVDPSLNASLWTLKIEFAFYLCVPFLWRAVRRYGPGLLIVLFFLSAFYQVALQHAGYPLLAKQLPGQLQYFLVGIAAYRFRHRVTMSRSAGVVAGIGLVFVATVLMQDRPPILYPLVGGALVIVLALSTPRVPLRLDVSYGVYLLHAPLIQLSLLFNLYRPGWDGVGAVVTITLVLAALVERLIEAPGIALGRRLAKRIGSPPAGRSPAAVSGPFEVPEVLNVPEDLNVIVLNDFCYIQGGASKVAIEEAIGLARSGIRVIFVGAVGPVCADLRNAPLRVECLNQNQLLDGLRNPAMALQGLWNSKAGRRVGYILRSLPRHHTVVHLHGYTKALTTSPVRTARRLGVPVICTLHDFFAACPNGAFFDYEAAAPCSRRPLSGTCILTDCDKRHYAHKLFRVVRGVIQRFVGRFPSTVVHYITLSDLSAAVLAPYLPARACTYRLANPIDVTRAPPVPVAANRRILYVGRLDEEKGVRVLLQAAAKLALPVTFVGDGPLRPEIEASPGAVVTGWLAGEQVRRHLSAARCLVFPSLWYETFGLTVTEAAALGIPAIVSDISAAAERVEDGVTGWHFKSGDAADLARCLMAIKDDRAVRMAGIAAYHAFWAIAPTPDLHTADLLRIYQRALTSGSEV